MVAAAACGDDGNDADADADDAIDEGEMRGEAHANDAMTELGDDVATDILAKSGHIMITVDEGEIMQAQFAAQAATDPEVLEYAQRMITDHSLHIEVTEDLLAGHGVQPVDNPISVVLRNEAAEGLRQLEASADVDYEYMRMQVMMHSQTLVIIDTLRMLAPFADVEQYFVDTRVTVADHRDHAEDILRDM